MSVNQRKDRQHLTSNWATFYFWLDDSLFVPDDIIYSINCTTDQKWSCTMAPLWNSRIYLLDLVSENGTCNQRLEAHDSTWLTTALWVDLKFLKWLDICHCQGNTISWTCSSLVFLCIYRSSLCSSRYTVLMPLCSNTAHLERMFCCQMWLT